MLAIERLYSVFRTDGEMFVHGLYQELLNRPPDPDGQRAWAEALRQHGDKSSVLRRMLATPEAESLLVPLPDMANKPGGLTFVQTMQKVLVLDGHRFVIELYRELLRREPDTDGLLLHTDMLHRGVSKQAVLFALLFSGEAEAILRAPVLPSRETDVVLRPRGGRGGAKWPGTGAEHTGDVVSIVIPTVNDVELTASCVRTIAKTIGEVAYEIIVVDDGSNAGIRSQLKAWAAEADVTLILQAGHRGFSHTVNRGMTVAKGNYVLLVNNDVTFQEHGWLESMLSAMQSSPNVGIVGARLVYPDGTIQHGGCVPGDDGWVGHRYRFFPQDYPAAQEVDEVPAVTGALMLLRRQMLDTIGGLSEDYLIGFEDIDLCYRARANGWKVVYCGPAVATHLESKSRAHNPVYGQMEQESHAIFQSKWGQWTG